MEDRTIVSSNETQGPQIMPQESSLFHLTLNELQNQLGNIGKPLNSMNLDEFVRVVISVEEMQFLQNPSNSSFPSSLLLGNFHFNNDDLSTKTVSDIWNEIRRRHQQQQLTLGEIKLEDFLVHAGIVTNIRHQNHAMRSSIEAQPIDPMSVLVSQQTDWFNFQIEQQQRMSATTLDSNNYLDNNQVVSEQVFDNDVSNYSENHQLVMSMPNPTMSASSSSNSKSIAEKRRRHSDDVMNKTIERRQKRMIKNRESAARSRARKQAYTNQLEQQVVHLKELNGWLKKEKKKRKKKKKFVISKFVSVHMEAKKHGDGFELLVGQSFLLTCAGGDILSAMLNLAVVASLLPSALPMNTIRKNGDCENNNYSKSVDGEDGNENKADNDDGDCDFEEGLSSDQERGGSENNLNDNNNTKDGHEGEGSGAGGDSGDEEKDGNDHNNDADDNNDEDNDDDEDEHEDEDEDEDEDEHEDEDEEKEPENEEEYDEEEEELQPPKKRKK